MKLYNIPFIGKWRTKTAAIAIMLASIAGVFHGLGEIAQLISGLLQGSISLQDFAGTIPQTLQPFVEFAAGYGLFGLRDAINKVGGLAKTIVPIIDLTDTEGA